MRLAVVALVSAALLVVCDTGHGQWATRAYRLWMWRLTAVGHGAAVVGRAGFDAILADGERSSCE